MSIDKNYAGLLSVSYNSQSLQGSTDTASDSKGAYTFSSHNLLINLINLLRVGKTKMLTPMNTNMECGGRP